MALDVLSQYSNIFNTVPALLLTALSVIAATLYTISRMKKRADTLQESEIAETHRNIKRAATSRLEERLNANRNVAESMMPGRWSTDGKGALIIHLARGLPGQKVYSDFLYNRGDGIIVANVFPT